MLNKSLDQLRRLAHYEIEAMCDALMRSAQSEIPKAEELFPFLAKNLATRISALNDALAYVVGDDSEDAIDELRREVVG